MTQSTADVLAAVLSGRPLSTTEAALAVDSMLSGGWGEPEFAAFLIALRSRGETTDELVGAALSVQQLAVSDTSLASKPMLLDTCGTGGDGASTFNVSTAVAFVVAGCGVKVAKHGNRSVSSTSGSADALRELGVNLDASHECVDRCLDSVGLAFYFAPVWHPAVAKVQAVRRQLKARTIFNLLGPLCNPARATHRLVGIGTSHWQDSLPAKMAQALQRIGVTRALVLAGSDGLDEITLAGPTRAIQVSNKEILDQVWTPEDFGLNQQPLNDCIVAGPRESAAMITAIFDNRPGAPRDLVVANAGAALFLCGLTDSLKAGAELAANSIASGAAKQKLADLISATNM